MNRTLAIVLAYDGTALVGWQRQASGVSVQGLLESALSRIEGRDVAVCGAGRTDAGVHASAQVASCRLEHAIPVGDLRRALNAMLPPAVRVERVVEVAEGFHARYSARAKTYRYSILNDEAGVPSLARFAWRLWPRLDVEAMGAAARLVVGTHDFAAFRSAGSPTRTTIRTMTASSVIALGAVEAFGRLFAPAPDCDAARIVVYSVTGDGFLRHMVRAIVGSLVEVGMGRQDVAWFDGLLRSGGRESAGPTAPALGLCLAGVQYDGPGPGDLLARGPASL